MKFSTKAIHEGSIPDKTTGSVTPPIYLTSTFAQEAPGEHSGYEYTRAGNPNFTFAEKQLASLENARYATVFSSGLGALTAYLCTMKQGDHVIAFEGLYGGTFRLFHKIFAKFGLKFSLLSLKDLQSIEKMFQEKPQLLLFETPTNPLLDIVDIAEMTSKARAYGITTLVDNTFASPYFQNPLDLGADIVWHSCTKYLGGHSDVIGGAMMTNDKTIHDNLFSSRMAIGVNPSPFDVWLLMRSIKTLEVRMKAHEKNAKKVAEYLAQHRLIKKIHYPGLPSHPNHAIAKKQMRGFSGIVSAEFDLSIEETKELISSFRFFTLAESLGGVESLVNHPATMTHASIPPEERKRIGLSDGLIRFSVGIEDAEDLIEDLDHVLGKFGVTRHSR